MALGWYGCRYDSTADYRRQCEWTHSQLADQPRSQLLFVDSRDNRGHELWTSDGTVSGTALLKDIRASGASYPSYLTVVGNKVFFMANDGVNGIELWATDGTATGTNLVKDYVTGTASLVPRALVEVNGWLAISARDIQGNNYLLRSDGTSAGTTLLSNKPVTSMANVNGQLIMVVEDLGQPPACGSPMVRWLVLKSSQLCQVKVPNYRH